MPKLSLLRPRTLAFIHPLELAGIRAPHANEESTVRARALDAGLHARTVRRTASATSRVPPSLAVSSHGRSAIGQRSKTLQQIERAWPLAMQLGNSAADSMDIAAAPAWLQSSVASGAGRDAKLLLLQFRGRAVAISGAIPTVVLYTRPTQAIRASFTP